MHSLIQIETRVLTSHTGKMDELQFYGSCNIAFSDIHVASRKCFYFIGAHCNIITEPYERYSSKNRVAEKMDIEIF